MITTHELLQRTGIKSAKTLTRWHQAGIIPEPVIGTHPSGRGKIGYWQDWVVDRCVRVLDLRQQGHSLRSALLVLTDEATDVSDGLSVTPEDRGEDGHSYRRQFFSAVLGAAQGMTGDPHLRERLGQQLNHGHADVARELWSDGFNPIVVFDGTRIDVTPDFMIAHRFAGAQNDETSLLVVLLHSFMRRTQTGGEARPTITPAPKVWSQSGGVMTEYEVHTGGRLGFSLVDRTAIKVGDTRTPGESEAARGE